jgi:hypothetical protein
MDAKTLIEGLAARAAELGASTEKNQTQENMMITARSVQSLESKVGKARAEKLYADANLDLSDPNERRRHRTLKTMAGILNKEFRKQSSSGASASLVFTKNFPDASPVAAHAAPASSPPKATHLSKEMVLEAILQISDIEGIEKFERMSDAKCWNSLEKLAFQNHVRVPGMRPDSELAEIYFRSEKPTGYARTMRADKQERLDELFNP